MTHLRRNRALKGILDVTITLVLIILATLFIRVYVVEARVVPTESMQPTVQPGDRVLIDRFLYRLVAPRRGDIIVFEPPPSAHEGKELTSDYLKRVIGLPGEKLAIHGTDVFVNDRPLPEPYLVNAWNGDHDILVPPQGYFVMGDNRPNSFDSRYWGAVPEPMVKGRAIAIYWPLDRAKWLVPGTEAVLDAILLSVVLVITLKLSSLTEAAISGHNNSRSGREGQTAKT